MARLTRTVTVRLTPEVDDEIESNAGRTRSKADVIREALNEHFSDTTEDEPPRGDDPSGDPAPTPEPTGGPAGPVGEGEGGGPRRAPHLEPVEGAEERESPATEPGPGEPAAEEDGPEEPGTGADGDGGLFVWDR